MPPSPTLLLDHLLRLAASPAPDAALLERFLRDRDEAAFAALVRRHGPMVFRVCRRVLADPHAAEDAFQATFLLLARQAQAIRHRTSLAAWLHGVAYRVALKARAAEARRHRREAPAAGTAPADPRPDPLGEVSAREALLLLEDEVARLPEVYRMPILLCCLEGLSLDEAAERLGWTRDSLKGRLERGRRRLHGRLARRGLTLAAALAAAEVARSAELVGLTGVVMAATVKGGATVVVGSATDGAGMSANALALAEGAVNGLTGSRRAVAALLLVLGLTAGAGLVARPPHAEQPPRDAVAVVAADREAQQAAVPSLARKDRYGDALPDGVIARLGTLRLRGVRGCLTFSPDGKLLAASAGPAGEQVVLWERATGREVGRLAADAPTLDNLAFSPDGKRIVCGGNSRRARVWDVAANKELFSVEGSLAAFTADGKTLVSADSFDTNARVRLSDAATGRLIRDWPAGQGVEQLALPANGRTLALVERATPDRVQVRDLDTGAVLSTVPFEGGGQKWMALAPDGKALVTARGEGVWLWDATSGKELRHWKQRADSRPTFSRDGKLLAWTGYDGIARLWVVEVDGRAPRAVGAPVNCFEPPCFTPDGKTLAVRTDGHAILLREVPGGKDVVRLDAHSSPVIDLALSPDGRHVMSRDRDGIMAWESLTARLLRRAPEGDAAGEYHQALLPDGGLLTAERTADPTQGLFRLRDPQTGREVWRFEGRPDVGEVAVAPGGRYAALSGRGAEWLCVLDLKTGRCLYRFDPEGGAFGLRLSADGDVLVWHRRVAETTEVHVRRHASGKALVLKRLPSGDDVDRWLTQRSYVSPDGRWLIVPEGDRLRRWDLSTGQESAALPDTQRTIWDFVWSPDGRLVAAKGSASPPNLIDPEARRDVRVWDVTRGKRLEYLDELGAPPCLSFSRDGRMLLTTDGAGIVHLREVATGKERRRLAGHLAGEVAAAALSEDGRLLASGGYDSQVLVWDLTGRIPDGRWRTGRSGPGQLSAWWEALAGADAGAAYTAAWGLASDPDGAAAFLGKQLRPVTRGDAARVRRLIEELSHEEFDTRERAEGELARMGDAVAAELRRALVPEKSPEARRRLQSLVDALELPLASGKQLQALRAVEALEYMGTQEAREVLRRLAEGTPAARLTREARASLGRLDRARR
jgi:RNA polymerase sigma factor (sigma-70 family)